MDKKQTNSQIKLIKQAMADYFGYKKFTEMNTGEISVLEFLRKICHLKLKKNGSV